MAEAWGAEFLCQKKRKNQHGGNFYFFDSKPEEFKCPYCQDGTLMKRVRIIDMKRENSRVAAKATIAKKADRRPKAVSSDGKQANHP